MLEILGSVLAITGATFLAVNIEKHPKSVLYAFKAFLLSNVFMLHLALEQGMIPLLIQYVLFTWGALAGVLHLSDNKTVKSGAKILVSVTVVSLIFMASTVENFSYDISAIEIFAASLAIVGNFVLKSKDISIRQYAFVMFIVADITYVGIGLDKELMFFTAMSAYFVLVSLKALGDIRRIVFSNQ